ncbi:MAG TPA: hypothetical protein VF234_08955 [Limnochordia bacterium]
MADESNRTWRSALRESWPTYAPAPLAYGAGAIAGLVVIWTPAALRICTAIGALFGDLVRVGWGAFSAAYVTLAFRWAVGYLALTWPFAVAAVGCGILLAWLRRHYGFYHRHIRWRPYTHRLRMPIAPHVAVAIVAGPAFLTAMALATDPRIYLRLLAANFMLWFVSGFAVWIEWEWVQYVLLRWRTQPVRRLELEYLVHGLIAQDPTLTTCRIDEIAVFATDRRVRVRGHFPTPQARRRIGELVRRVQELGPLSIEETGPEPPRPWAALKWAVGRVRRFIRPV